MKKNASTSAKTASRDGFTLVETLVAVSILAIAIVGPMVTASRALLAAYVARDQLTASYLAQEGIEYIRLMRDDVYLTDYATEPSDPTLAYDSFNDFMAGALAGSITTCLGAGDGRTLCQLNNPLGVMGVGTNSALSLCPGSSPVCSALSLSGGRYLIASGGTATQFTRSLKFYTVGEEIETVVAVSWVDNGLPYSTVVTDYLSPWQ